MGDEAGFDPCECIWGHEMAMRRLISLLRQSQAYCTDNECFQNVIGPQNQNQNIDSVLFMTLMFAFALLMYYLRPNFQNGLSQDPSKPANNDNDFNPPTPPTAS